MDGIRNVTIKIWENLESWKGGADTLEFKVLQCPSRLEKRGEMADVVDGRRLV